MMWILIAQSLQNIQGEKMKTNLTKNLIVLGFLLTYPILAISEPQKIVTSPASFTVSPGTTIEFDVLYPESNSESVTGLGVKMYFDSSKLNFKGVTQTYSPSFVNSTKKPVADTGNGDNDAETDSVINVAWADLSNAADWPGVGKLPATLYHATFTTGYNFPMNTSINFTGDVAANNNFEAASVPVSFVLTGGSSNSNPSNNPQEAVAASSTPATSSDDKKSGGGGSTGMMVLAFLAILGLSRRKVKRA